VIGGSAARAIVGAAVGGSAAACVNLITGESERMSENQQAVVAFIAVGVAVFVVTALVGPLWLPVVLAAVAAALVMFAVGRATRRT
jgi:hypothetical protein